MSSIKLIQKDFEECGGSLL